MKKASSAPGGGPIMRKPVAHGQAEQLRDSIAFGLTARAPLLEVSKRRHLTFKQTEQDETIHRNGNDDRRSVGKIVVGGAR
jgi:hypothetical protein